MRILWFTNSVMPAVLTHLGKQSSTTGPWMWSLLEEMAAHDKKHELCVVTRGIGLPTVSVTLDNIQYEVIGQRRRIAYWTRTPDHLGECAAIVRRCKPDVGHVP